MASYPDTSGTAAIAHLITNSSDIKSHAGIELEQTNCRGDRLSLRQIRKPADVGGTLGLIGQHAGVARRTVIRIPCVSTCRNFSSRSSGDHLSQSPNFGSANSFLRCSSFSRVISSRSIEGGTLGA